MKFVRITNCIHELENEPLDVMFINTASVSHFCPGKDLTGKRDTITMIFFICGRHVATTLPLEAVEKLLTC
jgi:hypothetical protein